MASKRSDCPFCKAKEAIYVSCCVLDEASYPYAIGQSRRHTAHCMQCGKRFIVEERRKIIPVNAKRAPNWLMRKFMGDEKEKFGE